MARPTWQKGIPLDDASQERLRALIRERGDEKKTAELIGVSAVAVLRAAAGVGLRRGTAHLIRTGLASVTAKSCAA